MPCIQQFCVIRGASIRYFLRTLQLHTLIVWEFFPITHTYLIHTTIVAGFYLCNRFGPHCKVRDSVEGKFIASWTLQQNETPNVALWGNCLRNGGHWIFICHFVGAKSSGRAEEKIQKSSLKSRYQGKATHPKNYLHPNKDSLRKLFVLVSTTFKAIFCTNCSEIVSANSVFNWVGCFLGRVSLHEGKVRWHTLSPEEGLAKTVPVLRCGRSRKCG